MKTIKVAEEKLDKLLNAFGHNCDYLFQEVFRKYCCHGIINNTPCECKYCQFKNSKSIKNWLMTIPVKKEEQQNDD